MKNNIKSDLDTRVFNENLIEDGKLVRFWNGSLGRHCYVPSGTRIKYYDTVTEKSKFATISKNTSEIYKVIGRERTHKNPTSNDDIDHFLLLENGDKLAVTLTGGFYFEVSEKEYSEERIQW